jgi:hypothetical protein
MGVDADALESISEDSAGTARDGLGSVSAAPDDVERRRGEVVEY